MTSNSSYKDMAKSSGLIAIVQIFQMIFGLIRNKGIALMAGAEGFGIWSLMQTFIEMIGKFSVLGLDQSGVREIAKSSDDKERIGRCIFTFSVTILAFSIMSGTVVLFFAKQFSEYLFNNDTYTNGIRCLAITVVLNGIAKGGYAILNGLRALRSLAISQIIGAVAGSIGTLLIVYFTGVENMALALSVVTVALSLSTTFFVYKLGVKIIRPSKIEYTTQFKSLLRLGLGFTIAGVVSTIMTLLSRHYLCSHYAMDAVGIYQASWTIANLYIGIILSAMGIDFMPRLSKVCDEQSKMNEIINQQIQFSINMAALGITIIIVLAPLIMCLLFSSEFNAGVTIARWQILGVAMRLIAFPLGYAIMAKNKPVQYATIQIIFWVGDYLLLVLFSTIWGFDALGINYCSAYVVYLSLTYLACRRNHNFHFSSEVKKTITVTTAYILCVFIICMLVKQWYVYVICGALWLIQFFYVNSRMKTTMQIDVITYVKNRLKHK